MIKVTCDLKLFSKFNIGNQYEHNKTIVTFENFITQSKTSSKYIKINEPLEIMIPLTDDLSFIVQGYLTQSYGRLNAQLLEYETDGSLLSESKIFTIEINESIKNVPEIQEITDPSLNLIYNQMHDLYLDLKNKVETNYYKGQPGDNYVITEDDYEEISEITKIKVQEILNTKMSYYKTTLEWDNQLQKYFFVHDGNKLTYNELKDLFDAEDIFLYLEDSNLVMIPSMDIPNSAIAFTAAWEINKEYKQTGEYFQQPYLQRVIINKDNIVKTSQIEVENVYNKIKSYSEFESLTEDYGDDCYISVNVVKQIINNLQNKTIITASSNMNINGYSVPKLKQEDIIKIYNSIVSGNSVVLNDANNKCHFVVNQADSLYDAITISIVYFNVMIIDYMLEGNDVNVDYKVL